MKRSCPGSGHPARAAGPAIRRALALLVAAGLAASACGKKGPPLAPIVRLPAAPADVASRRAGDVARVQFRVPAANTDGRRPASVGRVEVYGFTGDAPAAAAVPREIVKYGTLVATATIREPPKEDEEAPPPTEEPAKPTAPVSSQPDRPDAAADAPPGPPQPSAASADAKRAAATGRPGQPPPPPAFGQGDLLVVTEPLGPAQRALVEPKRKVPKNLPSVGHDPWQPRLVPEVPKGALRQYYVVGVSRGGDRGAFSPAAAVPLTPPPSPPETPAIDYTRDGITVSWKEPSDLPHPIQPPLAEGMLDAKPLGMESRSGGYNVYASEPPADPVAPPEAPAASVAAAGLPKALNETLLATSSFTVPGIEFGKQQCFVVRAVAVAGTLLVESEATRPACVTPEDRFAPAPPKELSAVGSEGAISLIWEASPDADVAGYLVLRAEPGRAPALVTPDPVKETTFRDAIAVPGVRYTYTVVAVDGVGNRSEPSNGAEETAR